MEAPEKKSVDQLAHEALRAYLTRTFLLLASRSRSDADQLCAAHLRYERRVLPEGR